MRNMVKRLKYVFAVTATLLALVGLVCCTPDRPQWENKAIALDTEYAEYNALVGAFQYEEVTLLVEYFDGKTEETALKEEMLSEADCEKQSRIGKHTLTVNYKNLSCTFVLNVIEDETEWMEFLDAEKVYNGEPQSLSVTNLPSTASVEYVGNNQTNVGEYQVQATVTLFDGREMQLTATLTIQKAPLTVWANPAKAFVGQEPEFSYKLVGLVGSDTESALTALPNRVSTQTVTAVGVYKEYVKYNGAVANNYEISYINADYTILALPTIRTENGKRFLELGEYPQTVVSDSATVSALDEKIANGTLQADFKGYYTLDGNSYVKMESNHYVNGESYDKFTSGEKIVRGKTYYFAVEPIRWQVLSETDGLRLIAEKLLDTKPFWDIDDKVEIDGVKYNPNDYSQSSIRQWLNGAFMEIAFGAHEKSLLKKVTVTNGIADGLYSDYPCATTEDFVWLPSYQEITSEAFGFSTKADRMALTTDYTRATGTYMRPALTVDPQQIGYGQYYLRSAGFSGIREVSVVDCFGDATKEAQSGSFIVCVRPMISITLSV